MTKFENLRVAETIVHEQGSFPMFQHQYTLARQYYDIETSIEMALEQQDLLTVYRAKTQRLTGSSNDVTMLEQ